jgi:hypothetical protein
LLEQGIFPSGNGGAPPIVQHRQARQARPTLTIQTTCGAKVITIALPEEEGLRRSLVEFSACGFMGLWRVSRETCHANERRTRASPIGPVSAPA